jgi:GWxTD domain-containing protein
MKKFLFFVFVCFLSSIIFSDLGKYEGWEKTWVQHFLTKKEQKEFKKLKTEKEAEDFVLLFWAKRDPTPGTPRNEFKERCEMLVKIADKDYSTEKMKGSLTDRGKVLLLLGPPFARKEVAYSDSEGNLKGEGVNMTESQSAFMYGKMDVWQYRKEQLSRLPFELPWQELVVEFKKEEGQKDFYLNRNLANVLKAISLAQEGWIKSPDLKEVPEWAKTMGVSPFILLSEKILKGEEPLKKDTALTTYGIFYDSNNQTYGSNIIVFDENSPIKDQKEVNIFLQILDKDNNEVLKIEDKVAPQQTIRGFYLDRSFLISEGNYKLLQIVGKDDSSVLYSNLIDINVPNFKDLSEEGFWFALASDVKPLQTTYYENDPFVFGGVKIIPKLDLTFKKEDDLWYFYNLFHPAIDPETQKPKITEKIEIYKDGKIFRQSKESAPELTSLSEGRYASGKAYNIGQDLQLEPANYKFKLIIKDLVTNKTFSKDIEFKVE